MHDADSLDFGHYVSDVFDANTEIWWPCYDDDITKINDIQDVYILVYRRQVVPGVPVIPGPIFFAIVKYVLQKH